MEPASESAAASHRHCRLMQRGSASPVHSLHRADVFVQPHVAPGTEYPVQSYLHTDPRGMTGCMLQALCASDQALLRWFRSDTEQLSGIGASSFSKASTMKRQAATICRARMHLRKGAGPKAGRKLGELQLLTQRRRRCCPADPIPRPHPLYITLARRQLTCAWSRRGFRTSVCSSGCQRHHKHVH